MNYKNYFSEDYDEARAKFIEVSRSKKLILKSEKVMDNLFIDYAYNKSSKKKQIIIVSGTHGVEGFIGSAVQIWFIKNLYENYKNDFSFLFIHALNPFGMNNLRRVNENNVDLNRNCVDDLKNIQNIDPKSMEIINNSKDVFLPNRARKNEFYETYLYFKTAIKDILKYGVSATVRAAGFGQNKNSKSACYAGIRKEKSIEIFEKIIKEKTKGIEILLFIDIHTGAARKYKLNLFTKNKSNTNEFKLLKEVNKRIKNKYETKKKGVDHIGGLENIVFTKSGAKENIDLTLEFGTVFRFSTLFSLNYLSYMLVKENQITQWGPYNKLIKTRKKLKKLYSPSSKKFEKNTIKISNRFIKRLLDKFINY